MGGPEWVPIIPGRGQIREVAIELLSLADDPSHVRTTGNGSEFAVLPYVAERFVRPAPIAPAPNRRTRKKGDS